MSKEKEIMGLMVSVHSIRAQVYIIFLCCVFHSSGRLTKNVRRLQVKLLCLRCKKQNKRHHLFLFINTIYTPHSMYSHLKKTAHFKAQNCSKKSPKFTAPASSVQMVLKSVEMILWVLVSKIGNETHFLGVKMFGVSEKPMYFPIFNICRCLSNHVYQLRPRQLESKLKRAESNYIITWWFMLTRVYFDICWYLVRWFSCLAGRINSQWTKLMIQKFGVGKMF